MGTIDTATSGMNAQALSLSLIANNIANVSTPGYKASKLNFKESNVVGSGQQANGVQNQVGSGVAASGTSSDWANGSIALTSSQSDVAITGSGLLAVSLNGDVAYARTGSFQLVANDEEGVSGSYRLETADGAILLGGSGTNPDGTVSGMSSSSYVTFSSAPSSYQISADGVVTASPDGVQVSNAQLGVQNFENPDSLEKLGGGYYAASSQSAYSTSSPSVPGENATGGVQQGALEQSNVSLPTELASMLMTGRGFQANAKSIRTADEMFQTLLSM